MFKLLAAFFLFWAMSETGTGDGASVAIAIALVGAGLDTVFFSKK